MDLPTLPLLADARRFQGKDSILSGPAGANPGPACYRRGGPLAITDCNVMLGKIQPAFFPNIFGPRQDRPLDRDSVFQQFQALAQEIATITGTVLSPEAVAEGFLTIAVYREAEGREELRRQMGAGGEEDSSVRVIWKIHLRYGGTTTRQPHRDGERRRVTLDFNVWTLSQEIAHRAAWCRQQQFPGVPPQPGDPTAHRS